MSPSRDAPATPGGSVAEERLRLLEATQRLLGDTIGISEADWYQPCLLPGWSRAHLATHLARNADAIRGLMEADQAGVRGHLYRSDDERVWDIERGADRSGLDLQIDLDTSAGLLHKAFNQISPQNAEHLVELRTGQEVAMRLLPLARLHEIVLHHIDLDCGFTIEQVDEQIAAWLLGWVAWNIGDRPDFPPLSLHSFSGLERRIGATGEGADAAVTDVTGDDGLLVAWLTGRADSSGLLGTNGVKLPRGRW